MLSMIILYRKKTDCYMSHVRVCVYLYTCERHSKSNISHFYESYNMECSCNIANISYFSWGGDDVTVTMQSTFFQTPN